MDSGKLPRTALARGGWRSYMLCLLLLLNWMTLGVVWAGDANAAAQWKQASNAAKTALRNHNYQAAETHYETAIQAAEGFSAKDQRLTRTLYEMSGVELELGKAHAAAGFMRRALTAAEVCFGTNDLRVAFVQAALGDKLRRIAKHEEAGALITQALERMENGLGKQHHAVGVTLAELAKVRRDQGKSDEASAMFERALQILESNTRTASLGGGGMAGIQIQEWGSPPAVGEVISVRTSLALLHLGRSDFTRAEAELLKALKSAEHEYGKSSPGLCMILHNLALLEFKRGSADAAVPHLKRCLAIMDKNNLQRSSLRTEVLRLLGAYYHEKHEDSIAKGYLDQLSDPR